MRVNWRKVLKIFGPAVLVCLTACRTAERRADNGQERRELRVFAASSLSEAAGELEKKLEAAQPGVDVVLNLAGSQTLRLQIEQGAAVDVFISASGDHMAALEKAQLMKTSTLLAENELVVVVPASNPANVQSFADLPKAARVVVGAPEVPIGKYTLSLLEKAGKTQGAKFRAQVESHIVSREANVRLVLAKVELGEADAAIVYRTDLAAARNVRAIPLPPELAERTKYPMAVAVHAREPELAARWLTLATSAEGNAVLSRFGFLVSP
jgi:molybdate transport system substrate-binding protein